MEILIIILIILISALLLKKNFDLGIKVLLVLSTLLHKEVFSILRWDFLPVRFYMLGVCLFVLLDASNTFYIEKNLKKYKKVLKDPVIVLLILLWVVRTLSVTFSRNYTASVQLLAFFTSIVGLGIILFVKYAGQTQKLLNFIKFYIYLALGLTGFGFVQLFLYTKYEFIVGALWNVPGHVPRIGSTFWDVNHFAALLACLLPVLGVFILIEKVWKKKILYSGMFLTMTGLLLLTSSRTAWIIALVSFLSFITVLLVRRFGMRGIKYIVLTIVLLLIPVLREYSIKSSPFRAYVKNNFHYRLDSFAGHIMLLQGSYQIFEEYPILGGGYGGFFEHFSKTDIAAEFFGRDPAALNTRVPAHTIWGEAMSETGIIGLSVLTLFVLSLLGVMLFGALKIKRKQDFLLLTAIFSTMLGVFIAGIFYSYNAEFFWLILFIYYILSLSIVKKEYSYKQVYEYFVKSKYLYLTMIVFIAFVLIFIGLGSTHLVPWDEAIYAKIAKNMVRMEEYVNLYWKPPEVWYEKPPLVIWCMTFFMKMLGFTSLAARLPSAIFGFGTVIVTYLLSKKMFGKIAAYISALSLVTGIHFLYYARAAMIDVTTTFFITLSIYLFVEAKERKKLLFYALTGLATGLAVMTKGVVGFLPLVIMLLYEAYLFIFYREEDLKSLVKPYVVMLLSILVVALPWHLVMYLRYGRFFIDTYLLYHVVDRATQAIEEKGQPLFWYVTVMKVSMRVWFVTFIGALPVFLYKALKKERFYALFSIWFFIVFLIFSLATSKIVWYIIPLYPAASIMVGVFIDEVYKKISERLAILKEPIILFLTIFICTIFYLMYLFYHKEMVYTADLTKAEAELMQLKDKKLGTEEMFYIDRILPPLVMYYTDSPFTIIDFFAEKGRVPVKGYDNRIIILGKRGRFVENVAGYNQPAYIIREQGDYILWYYESDLSSDLKEFREVRAELLELRKQPQINSFKINQLQVLEKELMTRISVFKDIK